MYSSHNWPHVGPDLALDLFVLPGVPLMPQAGVLSTVMSLAVATGIADGP